MTHTSTEQPEALERLRQRLKFTHARHGHTARFVEATESDVKAVIDLADSLRARVQELAAKVETGKRLLREEMERANRYAEASQAQRVPLSDRKIRALDIKHGLDVIEFARAIEAAHGITQEKQG